MDRRKLVLAACLAGGLGLALALSVTRTSAGIFPFSRPTRSSDLRQQLASQLRPRSPREFAFLDRVVQMVDQKKLPARLVKATFNWARKKRRPFRFPYFERALRIQAAKVGIRIR